jgi:uncharacterized protein YeaO (DUF488 family)
MTKIKFLFLILTVLTVTVQAQNTKTDSLIGKWKFYDIYNKQGLDSPTIKLVKEYFSEMTLYFKFNNHYKTFLMNHNEEGIWSLNEATKKVRLILNKGAVYELEIIDLKNDMLTITMGEGSFVLTRAPISDVDNIEQQLPKLKTVKATKTQICKKWYLKRREVPGRSEAQVTMVSKLIKGAYAHFKSTGDYEAQSLTITESGSWVFGPDNKSIIVTIGSQQRIWNIKSVGQTDLVLISGYTDEIWKFSTKP